MEPKTEYLHIFSPWQRRSLESEAFLPVTAESGHSKPSNLDSRESGGSHIYHLKPAPINPRGSANPLYWCAPRTNVYITLTITHRVAASAMKEVLNEAYGIVDEILRHMGDGPVSTPGFNWGTSGAVLQTWNTNNQETTWKVLANALVALQEFMLDHRDSVGAQFTVYHGALEVGKGVIG